MIEFLSYDDQRIVICGVFEIILKNIRDFDILLPDGFDEIDFILHRSPHVSLIEIAVMHREVRRLKAAQYASYIRNPIYSAWVVYVFLHALDLHLEGFVMTSIAFSHLATCQNLLFTRGLEVDVLKVNYDREMTSPQGKEIIDRWVEELCGSLKK